MRLGRLAGTIALVAVLATAWTLERALALPLLSR